MRVLVACEESGVLLNALLPKGVDAYSCDLQPTRSFRKDRHFQCDVIDLLTNKTMSNHKFDALFAFPTCTDLCVSGARHFEAKRLDGRQQKSIDFFMFFVNYPAKIKLIENPIGIMSTVYRKPDQIIQPWQFGHGETKATCLWLTGLPPLKPTNVVDGREARVHRMPPSKDRAQKRSETYQGIAQAIADQYAEFLIPPAGKERME